MSSSILKESLNHKFCYWFLVSWYPTCGSWRKKILPLHLARFDGLSVFYYRSVQTGESHEFLKTLDCCKSQQLHHTNCYSVTSTGKKSPVPKSMCVSRQCQNHSQYTKARLICFSCKLVFHSSIFHIMLNPIVSMKWSTLFLPPWMRRQRASKERGCYFSRHALIKSMSGNACTALKSCCAKHLGHNIDFQTSTTVEIYIKNKVGHNKDAVP